MQKEETFTLTFTRDELQRMCGAAEMLATVSADQMKNTPTEMLDKQTEHVKRNRALFEKLKEPIEAADKKKAEAGPLANPPPPANRKQRRARR